jgi:hypothetical protein
MDRDFLQEARKLLIDALSAPSVGCNHWKGIQIPDGWVARSARWLQDEAESREPKRCMVCGATKDMHTEMVFIDEQVHAHGITREINGKRIFHYYEEA